MGNTMQHLEKILVVYDLTKDEHLAMQRSLDLAKSFDIEVCLFTNVFHYSYQMTGYLSDSERKRIKEKMMADAENKLQQVAKGLEERGLRASCHIGWGSSLHKSLATSIELIKPDLVLKAAEKKDDSIADLLFTPTDWSILRESSVDVLMVKEPFWPQQTHVLASIDVMAEDETHQKLNQSVLNTAKALADMCGVELHVCNVYPYPLVDVPIAYSSVDYQQISDEMNKGHRKRLQELTANLNLDPSHLHVTQGLVEEQVSELAKKLKADLIVMGTAGRKGLSGLVMGNTAEQILEHIKCDVWAVKPD